ncbi:MAG: hypothetical protein K2J04_02320 [Lachnospiraceae bacterium]|nr:hypothetical protein [Lachnospiraceae bacterium]
MNTVYFSGKLKKKYNAADVQNTICAFAKEHGFSVQCPDESKTLVDFELTVKVSVFQWKTAN